MPSNQNGSVSIVVMIVFAKNRSILSSTSMEKFPIFPKFLIQSNSTNNKQLPLKKHLYKEKVIDFKKFGRCFGKVVWKEIYGPRFQKMRNSIFSVDHYFIGL